MFMCMCVLSKAFSLFACVCTVDLRVWKKRERAKQRKGVYMFVRVYVWVASGGVLCVEVDKALCVSVHLPVMCVYHPRLTHSSHTRLI